MNPIKVDINDLDKFFVKSELTPAIAFDVDTKAPQRDCKTRDYL